MYYEDDVGNAVEYGEDVMTTEDWEADTWDALTDGQYGDYPGGSIDYDAFGFGG